MTEQIWTPNQPRATGCLRRKTHFGECCSLASERLTNIIDPEDWDAELAKLPGGMIDMSDCIGEFYDQDGYGSCAMESWNKAVEVVLRAAGYQDVPTFNPWFTYGIQVNWRGGPRVGTSIDENFTLLQKTGCCPEAIWPRSKGPNTKPAEDAYAAALNYAPIEGLDCSKVADIGSGLFERHPCVIGWSGHSELIVGLLPGKKVRVCGSYGSDYYGGKGWHDEPISKVDFGYGAIVLRTVSDLGLAK